MKQFMRFFLGVLPVFLADPALSECIDLTKGSRFSLTRYEPRLVIDNTVSADGTVLEEREMTRNGAEEMVTATYWNGVVPVERKSESSHIQIEISQDVKRVDLTVADRAHSFPVVVFVNGNQIDHGTFEIETIKGTTVEVGGCRYPVMVIRTSLNLNSRAPINEEALFSLEAGMLLGNVAMTPGWQPKHGVFFDEIKAN